MHISASRLSRSLWLFGFFVEAISELLCDNRVKEIFNFPDIDSRLSVSVQDNGKKRNILDFKTY